MSKQIFLEEYNALLKIVSPCSGNFIPFKADYQTIRWEHVIQINPKLTASYLSFLLTEVAFDN